MTYTAKNMLHSGLIWDALMEMINEGVPLQQAVKSFDTSDHSPSFFLWDDGGSDGLTVLDEYDLKNMFRKRVGNPDAPALTETYRFWKLGMLADGKLIEKHPPTQETVDYLLAKGRKEEAAKVFALLKGISREQAKEQLLVSLSSEQQGRVDETHSAVRGACETIARGELVSLSEKDVMEFADFLSLRLMEIGCVN